MNCFVDEEIRDLEFEVKEGETLALRLASFSVFPTAKIKVKIQKDGTFDGAFADFSSGNGHFSIQIDCLGEGAKATWHYAGRAEGSADKIVDASVEHLAPATSAEVSQYGIANDQSHLAFVGDSHIHNGMAGSHTAQKEKIIVFSQGAVGKCSPILRIDENDVTASHSAIVGRLSEEHLFYMLSRGIDEPTAKRLLTLGYLRPVLDFFEGDLKERIRTAIEGGADHD